MNQIDYYQAKLDFEIDSADLFAALNANSEDLVVDARSAAAYAIEHIPTAISLPHRSLSNANVRDLDSHKLYVCCCDRIGCNASTKGALALATLGFEVVELIGGLDWWKRDGYQTEGQTAQVGMQIDCG
ncbi:MAG: rhodanese-like domain-containing protein, partial [Pseudomonadota bacterium]|nr:rhodanese-like domain-containing protein [Pseudomonadota bacterium]